MYGMVCWAMGLLLLAMVPAIAEQPDVKSSKRVLILHSFGRDYSPFAEMGNSFRTTLINRAKFALDLYEATVFKARFEQADEKGLLSYLHDTFTTRKPDVIVTLGFPAAKFMEQNRQELFPDIPIVVSHLERRLSRSWSDRDAVTVMLEVRPDNFVENILRLLPETETIVTVIGNSPLEQYWRKQAEREFARFMNRVKFEWLNELSLEGMKQKVSRLPPNTAILETVVLVDADGIPHPSNRSLSEIYKAANAPVFSYSDFEFGKGIVGGSLNQWNTFGQRIAAATLRILNDEKPSSIKYPPLLAGSPVYDWRELKRWNISEERLPPGSVVHFREDRLWQRYRPQIIMVAIAMIAQALLIAGLFVERHRRQLAEIEARNHLTELTYMNRRAAAGEASASIAHEINQPLAAIVSSGNAALRWLENKKPDLDETKTALARIVSDGHRAAQVIETLRGMYRREEPEKVPVDVNMLIRDVLSFLNHELEKNRISVKAVLTDGLPYVQGDPTQLKQVILNLVMNAAEAMNQINGTQRRLLIRSESDPSGQVVISVDDSGPGIAPEELDRMFEPFFTKKPKGMGLGLAICRTIAKAHDGQLAAAPSRTGGLVFTLTLPGEEDNAA